MENRLNAYLILIILHIAIGVGVYLIKPLSLIYGLLIIILGLFYVIRKRNDEILIVVAYIVGSEVFLRMTGGNILHEIAKYEVLFFSIMGIIYGGFSKKSFVFAICLLLLLPGVIVGMSTLSYFTNIRKAITFNLLGPITLLITSVYCYKRIISPETLLHILVALSVPIVSTVVYLVLYTPDNADLFTSTQSNFSTSGGFGPNQVSTILGLGIFTFFALFLLYSKTKIEIFFNFIFLILSGYRGIITFSRGGVFTAMAMILALLILVFLYAKSRVKLKVLIIVGGISIAALFLWTYSIYQTNGLIANRYENKDAIGRLKKDRLGGREEIAKGELELFVENPIFGIGVGKSTEVRELITNEKIASHSETTRMPAEHGILGVIFLVILTLIPILHFARNKNYLMSLPFFIFWLLTINHAAMRLAAPAVIYALSLLQINNDEKKTNSLSRE